MRVWRLVALVGTLLTAGVLLAGAPHLAPTPGAPQQLFAQFFMPRAVSGEPPTPVERDRTAQHAREGRRIFFLSLLYEAALLGAFLLLGGTRGLARLVVPGRHWLLGLAVVTGIVSAGMALLTLPVDYYAGYLYPHAWGLSNQTPAQWLREYALGSGVGLALGIPVLALFYWLLRRAPRTWWLWTAAASIPLGILLLLVAPVFISPLFNRFTPLQDETLRREILAMAHAQGIEARDVYQVDASRQSKAVNAYVTGFGPTHRIVLYDTLLEQFTPEEIKFIVAHEIGHYKLGHIRQGIILGAIGTLGSGMLLALLMGALLRRFDAFFGFRDPAHPASYPLWIALAFVLSVLATPAMNAISRQIEWAADRYALRIYGHPEAGISAFHKLARLNISEEDPPRWVVVTLYSHPSIAERVQALEATQQP